VFFSRFLYVVPFEQHRFSCFEREHFDSEFRADLNGLFSDAGDIES